MDMFGTEMPIIQRRIRRVLHWGSADQSLDITTKDDVAAYAAAAALDTEAPRILRIDEDTVSARDIARAATEVTSVRHDTLWAGNIGMFSLMIHAIRAVEAQPDAVFPPWQGMQHMRDMLSGRGRLQPLDNVRYPGLRWIWVRERLAAGLAASSRTVG
jgi:hypothetical protein